MSIKPIDLQTNLSQILEVGRGEQAKAEAIAEQQHTREKESTEKSQVINSKLDESQKGEKTAIRNEEKKENKKQKYKLKEDKKQKKNVKKKTDSSDELGRYIDVLK